MHEDLGPFLAPAEYVDSDQPAVVAAAHDLAPADADVAEVAVALFTFVRDLTYEPEDLQTLDCYRASHVLAAGHSHCVPKAGLLAALARVRGIPARVAFADVKNHLASPRWLELMGSDVFSWHGYTELHLEGRWVSASPTFDAAMCEKLGVPPLEFDGRSDALLQAFDGGGAMQYVVRRGSHFDVPARFLAVEMARMYPRLVGSNIALLQRRD